MNNTDQFDCTETPVWALYSCDNDAQIIHAPLPRYNDTRQLPSRMLFEGGIWTRRSGWFRTREELIEKLGIRMKCSECGKPFNTRTWIESTRRQLEERNLCFTCNHYLFSTIPKYGKPGHVAIGHATFSWNPDKPMVTIRNDGQFYGHGGREFAIRLFSGETIRTNNLWHGGQIPERFWDRLPDNATFEKIPAPIGHGQGYLG